MSSNVQITLEARRISLKLKTFAPDGPLCFTVVKHLASVSPLDVEEHSLSRMSGNVCRYSLTRAQPNGDGEYVYSLIMDFSVYHNPGQEQTFYFHNTGIRDFVYSSTSLNYAMFGDYAMYISIGESTNLTRASYWSLRKALPYPIYE